MRAVCGAVGGLFLLAPAGAPANTIFTVAGSGAGFSGDGGLAAFAQLSSPRQLAVAADGSVLIADLSNHRVRRVSPVVSPGETITTVAGVGTAGFSGDGGAATAAEVNTPRGVAVTADGGMLIADTVNHRVRRVSPGGTVATFAGTGVVGSSGDGGPATAARMFAPSALAEAADGSVLIADQGNSRVRRVSPAGTMSTFAGTGMSGFSGDGGAATDAQLFSPQGVAVAADGGVLIGDSFNHRVRRVSPGGTITTVAGTGTAGFSGDGGPGTAAELNQPFGVAEAADGSLLIADFANHRVRRVSPGGTISTVAGTGTAGFSGDAGTATAAQLNFPVGVAEAPGGGVLIADTANHRVRLVDEPRMLTVNRAGSGVGEVASSPGGIDCGGDCSQAYRDGQVVTLFANPEWRTTFAGWSGPCSGTGACQVTMSTDRSVSATFEVQSTGAPPPPPALPASVPSAEQGAALSPLPTAVVAQTVEPDRDRDGIPDSQDTSDASAGPQLAETVVVQVVSGDVFVRRPLGGAVRSGGRATQVPPETPEGFIPLKGAEVVPVGSVVHALRGRIALDSVAQVVRGERRTQRANFYDGIFQIKQARARQPVTELVLRSDYEAVCGENARRSGQASAAQQGSSRRVSRLWGDGRGRFRSKGRYSSATVRGTVWLVEDRCDGTLTRVRRGSVTVSDTTAGRTVTVRAGGSYLARAQRASTRRGR